MFDTDWSSNEKHDKHFLIDMHDDHNFTDDQHEKYWTDLSRPNDAENFLEISHKTRAGL